MGYRAFFSYARADDKIANWLHRQLDSYRTPKALIGAEAALGPVPAKLHPIFRDRTDLQAGGHIDASLQQALEESDTLIVLCTPSSAKSHWVNHECETFLKLGREARIFPVIADGEPDAIDPDMECFPPALRSKGLLAADLRELRRRNGSVVGDGRDIGRLKLIAGLLGLPLDVLARREQARQRRTMLALGAASTLFFVLALAASYFSFVANTNADLAEQNATEARGTLHRLYAERAWQELGEANWPLAARYALAGMQLSPQNEREYRSVLASIMFEAGEVVSLPVTEPLRGRAFSSDGGRLLTWSERSADVWDVSGDQPIRMFPGVRARISSASLSGDGEVLATVYDNDPAVRLWRVRDGGLLASLEGHSDFISTMPEFSPDSARVATTSADGTAKLWNVSDGRLIATFGEASRQMFAAEFSSDGARLLAYDANGIVQLADARTGRHVARFAALQGEEGGASFSVDGARIVSSGFGRRVEVRDARDGRFLSAFDRPAEFLAQSNDGRWTLARGQHHDARLQDGRTGALLQTLRGHGREVERAQFSGQGTRLAMSSAGGVASVWTIPDGNLLLTTASSTSAWAPSVMFAPDGERVMVSIGTETRIWSLRERTSSRAVDAGEDKVIAISPDGLHFVTANSEGLAHIRSIHGRQAVELRGEGRIYAGAFSDDGARVVSVSSGVPNGERHFDVWNANDGGRVSTLVGQDNVPNARLSPNNNLVATYGLASPVRIWSVSERRIVRSLAVEDAEYATFSNDGARIALGRLNGSVAVFDVESGVSLVEIKNEDRRFSTQRLGFSPNGDKLVMMNGAVALVVEAATGRQLVRLVGHSGDVLNASFSSDGDRILTAGYDGTARIWDAIDGRNLAILEARIGPLLQARLSNDGERVFARNFDGAGVFWSVGDLTQSWVGLAEQACAGLLHGSGRFTAAEMTSDILLSSTWAEGRDVCEAGAR